MDGTGYSKKSGSSEEGSGKDIVKHEPLRHRRSSHMGSASGDSRRASSVSHSMLHTQHSHQQMQAFFGIAVIIVCIIDLYALAPRLAFSGTPRNDNFQRILFWLQQTSSVIFILAYTIGMTLVRTNRQRKLAEAKRHASRHAGHNLQVRQSLFDLDAPPVLIAQIVLASLLPIITDLAMYASPKSRRHWKWIGVLRLLHLVSFQYVFSTLDTNLTIPHWAPPTLRNTLMLFFNTHYAACLFWYLARRKGFSSDTWVTAHADFLIDSSKNTQYLYSLYYAVITASTVGYGDYSPVSTSEVTVMISYVLVNVLLVANIVGGVSALATMHDTDIAEQRIRIARFSRMLKNENISEDVALATTEYLRLGLKMISFDARCDIDSLPVSVRIRIRDERFGHLLDALPLFRGVSHRFLAKCIAIAKDDAFVKGLEIARTGDLASRFCLILEGRASIELPTDFEESGDHITNDDPFRGELGETCSAATLSVGASFGAECFVCQLQQPWTIIAKTLLRVISFDDDDRRELETTFPNDWFKVRSNLLESTHITRRAAERLVQAAGSDHTQQPHHPFHDKNSETKLDDASDNLNVATLSPTSPKNYPNVETEIIDLKHMAKGRGPGKSRVSKIDDLKLCLEANVLHPNCIVGFANATKLLEIAIKRETSKASHQLSAMHCHIASTGDDAELSRLLDMVPVESVPGDYDGRAPIHLAAAQGHLDCCTVLLNHGAAVNPIDRFGRTPLVEAVLNGHDDIISALVARGAELKLTEQEIASRMCAAANIGDLATVRRYLDAGAKADAADYDLRTALMLSAAEGNVQICKLLLDRGAVKSNQDRWGHTAYDEAVFHGHTGTLADLLSSTTEKK